MQMQVHVPLKAPGKMPADPQPRWIWTEASPRPTPCSWCAGPTKEEDCPHPTEGEQGRRVLFLWRRQRCYRGRCKKLLFPQQLKEGLLEQVAGAALPFSIQHTRKFHLVIRRRGGKRSNQTPIQAPFSDSPCWLGWSQPNVWMHGAPCFRSSSPSLCTF